MATCKNLEFTINSRVIVSDETADRCLRLLKIWMDDNPDKLIECTIGSRRHQLKIVPIDSTAPEAKEDDQVLFPEWDVIPVEDIPSYTGIIILEDYPTKCYAAQYTYTDEKTEEMVFRLYEPNMDGVRIRRKIGRYAINWRCWDKPMSSKAREAVKWK